MIEGFGQGFAPIWVAESRDSEVTFPWIGEPIECAPKVLIVADGGLSGIVTEAPTENGSRVYATESGVVWHLTASDAQSLTGRNLLIGLWLDREVMDGEPDQVGQLVVSDWAFAPHKGTA